MQTNIRVDYRKLSQKDAVAVRQSTSTERYIVPAPRTPKNFQHKAHFIILNGVETMFNPSKDYLVQIGTTMILMSDKEFKRLEVKTPKADSSTKK